eukprot:TRINITY_DN3102_c0_g1_i2.p1 TRINITY_DN3102_c0_g1~~TRINITY_DN3102_c0_g1_i2.p1  ORF type:complete len:713 (+),score=114.00 TRINITY_DN3102_c0_g1_i2:80-2218(+)
MAYDLSPPRHRANFDPAHPDADRVWPSGSSRGSASPSPSPSASAPLGAEEANALIGIAGAVEAEGASPSPRSSPRNLSPRGAEKRWWPATLVARNADGTFCADVHQHGTHRWARVQLRSLRRAPGAPAPAAPEAPPGAVSFALSRAAGESWGIDVSPELRITKVFEGSPAWHAGVPCGDLVAIDGAAVHGLTDCRVLKTAAACELWVVPDEGGAAAEEKAEAAEEDEAQQTHADPCVPPQPSAAGAVSFALSREAGESWGIDVSPELRITKVFEGSPAWHAGVPCGALVAIDAVAVQALTDCRVLKTAAECELWVVPDESGAEVAEPLAQAQGLAADRRSPRNGLSPPRHRTDFDVSHPDADRAWPRDAQPRQSRGGSSLPAADSPTSHSRLQDAKRRHQHTIDYARRSSAACEDEIAAFAQAPRLADDQQRRGSAAASPTGMSPPRHRTDFNPVHPDADRAWPRDAQPGYSPRARQQPSPRAGSVPGEPPADTHQRRSSAAGSTGLSPPRHRADFDPAHPHADRAWPRDCQPGSSPRARQQPSPRAQGSPPQADERRGSCASGSGSVTGLCPPRHRADFDEAHPDAHRAWPRDAQPGSARGTPSPKAASAPRQEASSPSQSPKSASGSSVAPTQEQVSAMFGKRGIFEAKGASGSEVWWQATVVGPGTEPGTFAVDVYQYRTVRWSRVLPKSLRWVGGGPAPHIAELGMTA